MSCVSSVAVYGVVLPPSPIVFFHVFSSLLSFSLGEVHFNETRLSSVWRMDGMIFKSSFGAWSVGGKASQEDSGRLHASNLSSQRTHRDSHTGGWRIIPHEKLDGAAPHARSTPREAPLAVSADASTPASRALVLPSGYKAFSKQRRLLSDQDCPRQHHTAGKHGCGDSYWWVVTKLSPSFHQFVSMLSPSALLNLSAFIRRKKKQNN